jgi:glycosyltransferase involved in cell wall biosynthesis
MRVALVADTFPPLRTSGAVQLRDLARELTVQGHSVTVFTPATGDVPSCGGEVVDGYEVVRLRAPTTKDVSYVRRTLAELLMPYAMRRNLRNSAWNERRFDGVVWYSPSIFLGPFAASIKRASGCNGYLILRDIFPEWAVDMGLMGRGVPYRFFKFIANRQYAVADIIGVQTPGNLAYFRDRSQQGLPRVEVLHNWLQPPVLKKCSIDLSKTVLAGRKIFVYAGNMGIAQGMDILLDLATALKDRADLGFVFVGRGSDADRLREDAAQRSLDNVLFFDEIDPDEIPGLYNQCTAGIVALDRRHVSHNIPGKFISYMHCGLPVLATINPGNDLEKLIADQRVGKTSTSGSVAELDGLARSLLTEIENDSTYGDRCRSVARDYFSAESVAGQIVSALSAR